MVVAFPNIGYHIFEKNLVRKKMGNFFYLGACKPGLDGWGMDGADASLQYNYKNRSALRQRTCDSLYHTIEKL